MLLLLLLCCWFACWILILGTHIRMQLPLLWINQTYKQVPFPLSCLVSPDVSILQNIDIVISNKHKHRAPHAYTIRQQQLYRFKREEKERERSKNTPYVALRFINGHRILVCVCILSASIGLLYKQLHPPPISQQ